VGAVPRLGLAGGDVEEDSRRQRWRRGTLDIRQNEIVAEVSSPNRLARLLDMLVRAGASPVVTDETRLEPAQDLGCPAGPRALPRWDRVGSRELDMTDDLAGMSKLAPDELPD
jgi:hypothetical protein